VSRSSPCLPSVLGRRRRHRRTTSSRAVRGSIRPLPLVRAWRRLPYAMLSLRWPLTPATSSSRPRLRPVAAAPARQLHPHHQRRRRPPWTGAAPARQKPRKRRHDRAIRSSRCSSSQVSYIYGGTGWRAGKTKAKQD